MGVWARRRGRGYGLGGEEGVWARRRGRGYGLGGGEGVWARRGEGVWARRRGRGYGLADTLYVHYIVPVHSGRQYTKCRVSQILRCSFLGSASFYIDNVNNAAGGSVARAG